MDSSKDYYATLGVLPNAEDVVVRAAYRALAQRYHPDKFEGAKDEASRKMSEINEAYGVLSDPAQRKEYDNLRGSSTQSGDSYFGDEAGGAPPHYDPLEKDWAIAVKFYPDLPQIEQQLTKIAWRLAYTYRAYMLDAKAFEKRSEVAAAMERKFLESYFGTNQRLVEFAKELISVGNKKAAKALNEAIRVLGSNSDPTKIISAIRAEIRADRSPHYKGRNVGTPPDYSSTIRFLNLIRSEYGQEGADKILGELEQHPNLVLGSDSSGNTALHVAVEEMRIQLATNLLQHGADPLAKNNWGVTPLDLAASKKNEEMIDLLKTYQ